MLLAPILVCDSCPEVDVQAMIDGWCTNSNRLDEGTSRLPGPGWMTLDGDVLTTPVQQGQSLI